MRRSRSSTIRDGRWYTGRRDRIHDFGHQPVIGCIHRQYLVIAGGEMVGIVLMQVRDAFVRAGVQRHDLLLKRRTGRFGLLHRQVEGAAFQAQRLQRGNHVALDGDDGQDAVGVALAVEGGLGDDREHRHQNHHQKAGDDGQGFGQGMLHWAPRAGCPVYRRNDERSLKAGRTATSRQGAKNSVREK